MQVFMGSGPDDGDCGDGPEDERCKFSTMVLPSLQSTK